LGDYLYIIGSSFEKYRSSPNFWLFSEVARIFGCFSTVKLCNILTNLGWATFWEIFSQTHLVTLLWRTNGIVP
jgi:hypothetical protein